MNNFRKGFIAPVLLAIITVLLIGGGAYYVMRQNLASHTPAILQQTTSTTTQPASSQIVGTQTPVSVPHMSKYTDVDFGFSFWYPSGWTVESSNVKDSYVGGTVQKSLTISPPASSSEDDGGDITIDEFNSPSREITIPYDLCSPMSGSSIPAHRYYFDLSTQTWMVNVPAYTDYSSKDGSQYHVPANTTAADISVNTMGGLHVLPAGCSGYVIPLSAEHLVVFGYNHGYSPYYYNDLAKTIVATNPAAATPSSSANQVQTIITEGILFGAVGTHIGSGWYSYNGVIYDHNAVPMTNADAASFKPILFQGNPSNYASDKRNVYGWSGVIADADPTTFSIVPAPDGSSSSFEKDKSHVWNEGELVPGADPNTFTIVVNAQEPDDTFFQKDATRVWDNGKIIPNADPATFVIINQTVWQAALFEKDATHVWYDGMLIPKADPRSFVVSTFDVTNDVAFLRDVNHSFELHNLLDRLGSTTIQIDDGSPILLQ